MVTCAKCRATAPDASLFCGHCGAPLGAPAAPAGGSLRTVPESPISAAVRPVDGPAPAPPIIIPPAQIAPQPAPSPGPPPAGAKVVPGPPAGAPAAAKHLPVGTVVDQKYSILRVLGEGGMGVVYLARDVHTGLDVVVKAIRTELAHREDVRARTLAEGRALAQIDHPNVVHLKAVAVEGVSLYLVMQYIEGESLDRAIGRYHERGEQMPVNEALGIFRQVAAGVGAAHEEGVIHRDLKPANVLLRKKDGTAKVTDFGIAKVASDTGRVQTRGIIGSLWYMSPEQVTGRRDLDRRVDIYALGILLYQMLVGHVPFDAKSDYEIMRLHAEAPMPRVAAVRAGVSPEVDDIIQKACAKDRDQRFQTCAELIAAIDRALARTPSPAAAAPNNPANDEARPPAPTLDTGETAPKAAATPGAELAQKPAPPRRRRWPWVILALVVIAAGGAVAAIGAGLVPGFHLPLPIGRPARAPASASAAASASPSASAAPRLGVDAMVGAWTMSGRDLDAVIAGGDLELRVKQPDQFPQQGYLAGDARFVLRPLMEPGLFSVEDRVRPSPPAGKTYDASRARASCQEPFTAAGLDPLRARFDGARLSVDSVKIEPGKDNFTVEGARVVGCRGLAKLTASKVVVALTRP